MTTRQLSGIKLRVYKHSFPQFQVLTDGLLVQVTLSSPFKFWTKIYTKVAGPLLSMSTTITHFLEPTSINAVSLLLEFFLALET